MIDRRWIALALAARNALSRLILPVILGTIVVACAPTRQSDTVPLKDRIPDSTVARGTAQCKAKARPSFTPDDNAALCTCVFREVQRTMSSQEVDALYDAQAPGLDEAAKTHAVLGNEKMRRVIATCINELGTPSASSTNSATRPSSASEYGRWRSQQVEGQAYCYDPKLKVVSIPSPPLGCLVGDQQITEEAFKGWQRTHKP
jgi:hypothetical protein